MFRAFMGPSSGVFQAVVFMLPFGSCSALLIVCVRQWTGLRWWSSKKDVCSVELGMVGMLKSGNRLGFIGVNIMRTYHLPVLTSSAKCAVFCSRIVVWRLQLPSKCSAFLWLCNHPSEMGKHDAPRRRHNNTEFWSVINSTWINLYVYRIGVMCQQAFKLQLRVCNRNFGSFGSN